MTRQQAQLFFHRRPQTSVDVEHVLLSGLGIAQPSAAVEDRLTILGKGRQPTDALPATTAYQVQPRRHRLGVGKVGDPNDLAGPAAFDRHAKQVDRIARLRAQVADDLQQSLDLPGTRQAVHLARTGDQRQSIQTHQRQTTEDRSQPLLVAPAPVLADQSDLATELLEEMRRNGDISEERYQELKAKGETPSTPAVSSDEPTWSAKWSNGFKVERSDGAFKLKFGGRIQNDWAPSATAT